MTNYLTLSEVMSIQIDQIDTYGGIHGIRDMGQLQSALFRAQTGYYETVIEQAAALWESLSQNHAFLDGNKRTAFAATYTFLHINGLIISAPAEDVWQFLSEHYTENNLGFKQLKKWLEENTKNGS